MEPRDGPASPPRGGILRSAWSRLFPPVPDYLHPFVGSYSSCLDLGCGRKSRVPVGRGYVGVDTHAPSVREARAAQPRGTFVLADITRLPFRPASFDCVVALDVIEHLSTEAGLGLLAAMESIARRRVVVLTPNGFVPQTADEDNPSQVHQSGWTTEDFERRGYAVRGMSGLQCLLGERGRLRLRPEGFWGPVWRASQRFTCGMPRAAFHLLALRDQP